jgi:hypothetical protein
MARALVVSAADSNFFPFARGLYLSLLACGFPDREIDLGFIDIDDDECVKNWMYHKGIIVRSPEKSMLAASKPDMGYVHGQSIRAFLPELFHEHEFFVWIDSDAWVQRRSSVEILIKSSQHNPDKISISPTIDVAYAKFYMNYESYLQMYFDVYKTCYNEEVAKQMYGRAVFSSGVFSMSARCNIWQAWKEQLRVVYSKDYTQNVSALHVAEQLALNVAIYGSRLFVPLEATHNFHCHAGALVERDEATGKVVVQSQPFRELGIIHLSDVPNHLSEYLEKGLFWDCGKYLTKIEREWLRAYKRK